jgi:hypothetical protein
MLAKDVYSSGMSLYFPPIRWGITFYAHQPMGESNCVSDSNRLTLANPGEGGFLLPSQLIYPAVYRPSH